MKNDLYSTTYTTLDRMSRIHRRLLSGGQYPKCQEMAIECAVSTKTIQRDIKFMKDCWDLPIAFNKSIGGYEYTEEVMDFPAIKLNEEEVFAFLIARNSIERYQGTHFHEPLSRLYDKIITQMGFKQSARMKRVKEYVTFRPAGWSKAKYKILDLLSKACRDRKEISFKYEYPSKGIKQKAKLKPAHLINSDNVWYLLVGDQLNQPSHFYSLARMSHLKLHATTFPEIAFSIEKYMKNNFGIFRGDEIYEVHIVFDAHAAPYIKERKRNDSQKIKIRNDGGIDFHIQVNHLIEVKSWVMSWGKHATVVQPNELAVDIRDELKETIQKYPKT